MRRSVLAAALVLSAGLPGTAGASETCTAVFLRDSSLWTFGARRPAMVRRGTVMPKGSRVVLTGISRIGPKLWVYEIRSDRMFDRADLTLPPGCALQSLDTSEPD